MSRRLVISVGVLLFVAAQCLGFCYIPGTDVALLLVVGWVPFLKRVVPQMTVRWEVVGSTVVYVIVLAVGAHFFLRWLYREMKRADALAGTTPPAWKWRWTLGGLAIVLLMFTAGTAAIGVAHQTTWLVRSPEPLYRPGGAIRNRVRCASHLRQIGQGLQMYAMDHAGRYPDDVVAMARHAEVDGEIFLCPAVPNPPARAATTQEAAAYLSRPGYFSYVYFGKGLTLPVDPSRIIAVEPLENHEGEGINVLYGSGVVKWVDRTDAERVLLELGFQRVDVVER